MKQLNIYCFGLYCEGHGLTKSQVFVSIRETEAEACSAAETANKDMFPPEDGWSNHQENSIITIPKETVLDLAERYKSN